MAWILGKPWGASNPNFKIVSNPENIEIINRSGASEFLPWQVSSVPIIAQELEPNKANLDQIIIVQGALAVSREFKDRGVSPLHT